MRLDKFLKTTCLIKRRTVAKEAADETAVKVNGRVAKPSTRLKPGDIVEINMWNYNKKVKVTALPVSNSIPKGKVGEYIEIMDSYHPSDQSLHKL